MKTAELKKTVFEALGEASMCWSETPKGVFESSRAEEIGNRVMKAIEEYTNQCMDSAYTYRLNKEINALKDKVENLDKKLSPFKWQDQFVCNGCNCTVPKNYCHKTEGYCYLCDPNIPLSEALSENKPTPTSLPSDGVQILAKHLNCTAENIEDTEPIYLHQGIALQAMEEYASARIAEMERDLKEFRKLSRLISALNEVHDNFKCIAGHIQLARKLLTTPQP